MQNFILKGVYSENSRYLNNKIQLMYFNIS